MPRADLLALTADDLMALTNRGTVKRAEREVHETTCQIQEAADGTVAFAWSDDVRCTFPGQKVVARGTCSCPATVMCRHLVRSILAYQKQAASQPDAAVPVASWNPGDISDDDLARHFKPAMLARARDQFEHGLLVELVRGSKPSAYFHEPPCLLRFLVPGDVRYSHCDCAETAPCRHVPPAVWAFRRLEAGAASGMVATETQPLPVPTSLLDDAEEALLGWTEAGFSGASAAMKDQLAKLEKRCRAEGLTWPAEILAEMRQMYERYVQRDALFDPLRVVELVGEFLSRADAIRRPTGTVPQLFVRGSALDRSLDIGSALCRPGLWCPVPEAFGGVGGVPAGCGFGERRRGHTCFPRSGQRGAALAAAARGNARSQGRPFSSAGRRPAPGSRRQAKRGSSLDRGQGAGDRQPAELCLGEAAGAAAGGKFRRSAGAPGIVAPRLTPPTPCR